MHWIDPQRIDGWHQQRRQDNDCSIAVKEHANENQQHVDDQQEDRLARRDPHQQFSDVGGHPFPGQYPGKSGRSHQNQHDRTIGARRFGESQLHLCPGRLLVGEADDQRIDAGHSTGFRRREDPVTNPAENQHHQHQAPERFERGLSNLSGADHLGSDRLVAALARHIVDRDHQQDRTQDARPHAAHEQFANRGIGNETVDDQPDTWRKNRPEQRRRRGQRRGKRTAVAVLAHLRHQHLADHRRISQTRA